MANEAVPIALSPTINPVRRTVANGQAIEKYTILQLIDPNTVAPSSGATGCVFGGIAAAEKVASDGSTSISAYMDGVFDCVVVGSCTIGEELSVSGANMLKAATEAEVQLGELVGVAEEAATGTETIRVRLRGGNL